MKISGVSMVWYILRYHKYPTMTTGKDDFEYPTEPYGKNEWWRWVAAFLMRIFYFREFYSTRKGE